jgi:hypothetical protein
MGRSVKVLATTALTAESSMAVIPTTNSASVPSTNPRPANPAPSRVLTRPLLGNAIASLRGLLSMRGWSSRDG